jgi:hypothetical protein
MPQDAVAVFRQGKLLLKASRRSAPSEHAHARARAASAAPHSAVTPRRAQLGNLEHALGAFSSAAAAAPWMPGVLAYRAYAEWQSGRPADAGVSAARALGPGAPHGPPDLRAIAVLRALPPAARAPHAAALAAAERALEEAHRRGGEGTAAARPFAAGAAGAAGAAEEEEPHAEAITMVQITPHVSAEARGSAGRRGRGAVRLRPARRTGHVCQLALFPVRGEPHRLRPGAPKRPPPPAPPRARALDPAGSAGS